MTFDRLRYEFQLMGKKVLLTPLLVMLAFAAFAVLLHILKVDPSRFLSGGLEMILPIAAGVIVGTVAVHDTALELQLTMPKKYQVTALYRLFLIMGWTACIALLSSGLLFALNLTYVLRPTPAWSTPLEFLIAQMSWIATLLWCVAVGLCFALLLRSRSAGGALLAGVWIAEIFFKSLIFDTVWLRPLFLFPTTLIYPPTSVPSALFNTWLTNRFEVLAIALVLFPLGWLLLRNTEGLLQGSSEE